jgi:aminopeptidase N
MDYYFDKFDGQAVTTEDFLRAMEIANTNNNSPLAPLFTIEGNKVDLSKMQNWYNQAGTPVVDVISDYDEKEKTYTLFFRQTCPKTPETK